jgi:hypothetical protein
MNFLVVKTSSMEAPFFVKKGNRISTFLSVNHGWCWTVRAEALPYIKKVGLSRLRQQPVRASTT